MTDYNGDEQRVTEWEDGLPNSDDLTPLSQSLIPPELASAFKILPEPSRTAIEVNRASEKTLSSLRLNNNSHSFASHKFNSFDEEEDRVRSDRNKTRTVDCNNPDEEQEEYSIDDQASNRTLKRPRLVWTPQLHKRFVEVVVRLGIKNAVPKTIMQLMNVEGLTRENVASHLQKYRLYLKRMHRLSSPNEQGTSVSDSVFDSSPVPERSDFSSGNAHSMPITVPYSPAVMTMPIIGHGVHMGMGMHHPYNMMQQPRDWSSNAFGAYPSYVAPNEK